MGGIAAVTTFSQKGYEVYGRRMLESFELYWPEDVLIFVYYEGKKPYSAERSTRVVWCSLDADKDRAAFIEAHNDHPFDYRKQPVKFCHKVFAVTAAVRLAEKHFDWLIWLDGDVETIVPVSHEFLKSVLPDGVVASYLGRHWWKHTEAGFLAYRLSEDGFDFLTAMRSAYNNGLVLNLKHQHDCAVFDHWRARFEANRYKFNNLGEDYHGPDLDVMAHSALAKVMVHNKGNAKKLDAYGAVA